MDDDQSKGQTRFCDVSPSIEFGCWVVLVLAPLLRLINGPAVSTDQFVVQVILVVAAAVGAIGLRVYNFRHRKATR